MKNLAKDQDYILEDGIYLPSFLFLAKKLANAVSPTSGFNPAGALEDSAFQSSISPSQSFVKKKILIDKDSFGFLLEEGERIAFLKRLQVAGFTVFFRGAENENGVAAFHKLETDLSNIKQLKNISQFNPETDPEEIKKLGIARDEILILDAKDLSSKATEIQSAFCQKKYHSHADNNDWNIAFSNDSIRNVVPPLPLLSDPQYLQKMAFVLDRSMGIDERDSITNNLGEYFNSGRYVSVNNLLFDFDMEGLLTLLLLNSGHTKEQLNLSVVKKFNERLENFVFKNIYSNKEFFAAIELFPHRHLALESYLENLSKFGVLYSYEKYPELIEKFPDKKEQLIGRIEHESKLNPDLNLAQFSSILAATLRGKEGDSIQKFHDLFEHLNSSEDQQEAVLLKCKMTAIFARAARSNLRSDFFDSQLLQNIGQAIDPSNPQIDHYNLDSIILGLNPENIVKIANLVFATNQNFLSEKLVIAAARANPQIAEQLVKTYCSKIDADIDSKKRVICSLPSRMVQNFLHGKVINSSDQFLLLEDWVGLKPSINRSDYQSLKHTTSLQSYDASEYSIGECAWWLSDRIGEDLGESGSAENIVTVKIANRDGEIDIEGLKSFIDQALSKKVKHFSFAANLSNDPRFAECLEIINQNQSGATYEINDYENYWGIGNSIRESVNKVSSEIRIAFNGLQNHIAVDNSSEKPTYNMGLAGEVLNGSSADLQIRTSIIANNITQDLQWREYYPQSFSSVSPPPILDQEELSNLRTQESSEHIFCKFQQSLKANIKSRLLSVDAVEDFYGIVAGQLSASEIIISKGDDGFFYAQSSKDCDLDYVIKAPNPAINAAKYSSLSQDDPIRKIIDEYRDPKKGFRPSASADKEDVKYDSADHAGSMARMFDERLGSCRHRAAAVLYKIRSSLAPSEQERCRMVYINNNHVILEVKSHDGNWVKADLGGSENYKSVTLPDNKKYQYGIAAGDIQTVSKQGTNKFSAPQEIGEAAQENPAQPMFDALYSLTQFPKVNTEQGLMATIDNKSKSLIVASNIADNANFLLQQAVSSGREVFYIDDPKKARLHKMNLQIGENETPFIAEESPLFDFLQRATSANNPLLLINWDAFDASQKVAMNTILDQTRMISDVAIDDSIQVVGFSSDYPKDTSFIYRHDACVVSEISPENNKKEQQDPQIIDLEGFSDWRRKLFGSIILVGEEMIWQKSDFVLALERGEKNFKIINLLPDHEQELQYEVKQATASGKLTYHGYEIAVARDLEVTSRGDNAFSFDRFDDESQISVRKYSTMPQGATLINKHLFDLLLCDHEITGGLYREKEGLIEKAAGSKEKSLKLFISSELSDGQWYCLFNEAQKRGLKLELYLSNSAEIPHQVKINEIDQNQPFKPQEITAGIFVHKDTEKALEKVKENLSDIYAVIDVEDFSYQDLVERIDFETTKSGFRNFRKAESQVVERLKEGKKIVLKGKFSEGLLNSLSPLLIEDFGRNLTLIVEEDENSRNLSWLSYKKIHDLDADEARFSKIRFEEFPASTNLQNSEEEAQRFILERKSNLLNDLRQNNMLRLVGHSGVGKSSLLREFENDDQDSVKVYRELNNFEEWARSDGAAGKMKILFIDESNMEDLHLTMFSPLKRGGQQRIFYKQKFYELDENHKVIFACNPAQYGGGRFEQKLFDDGQIPAVELRDFPPSYIYERILKKTIYDNLAPEIQAQIPQQVFKEDCAQFIQQYQQANSGKDAKEANPQTVRELQENVLRYIEITTSQIPSTKINNADFVSTNATKEVEESLALSLRIRQKQSEGKFPHQACGLNSVLLNGDSGTGKSVLIKSVLKNEGLSEIKYESEASPQKGRGYYKISANLPLQEKKKIITRAFEEGNVVWIDELNSCIDDGLEKVLNAVLTGEHPEGKSGKPGFMLISSINSATELEGRSMISPALRHRTLWHDVKSLKNYEENDFSRIVACWTKDDPNFRNAAPEVARDFMACVHSLADTDFNLRMLKMTLPSLAEIYSKESSLSSSKSPKNTDSRSPNTAVQVAREYEGKGENFKKMVRRQKARIEAREAGLKESGLLNEESRGR